MPQAQRGIWVPTIIVFFAGAIATALVPLAVPILGPLSNEFGIAGARLGWIVSVPSLLCAIGALALGLVVDRVGDVRMLMAGALLAILGDIGVSLAPHLTWLFAARLFQGLSYGCLAVAGPAFLQRAVSGDARRAAMALWAAHTPLGFALAVFAGAQLVAAGVSWRYSFFGHAAFALVVGLALLSLRRTHTVAVVSRSTGTREVLASPRAYAVAAAASASALLQTGMMVTLPTILRAQFAFSPRGAALVVVAAMVANWAGAMVIVVSGARRRPRIALPTTAAGAGILSVVVILGATSEMSGQLTLVLVFAATIGAANSLIWSLMPAVVPFPGAAGATAGLITQGSFIGVLAGPPLFFLLIHQSRLPICVCIALLVLLMVLALWATKRIERHSPMMANVCSPSVP